MTDGLAGILADDRVRQILAHEGIDRAPLADQPLRACDVAGGSGVSVAVRLPSYRSLPLSCIANIDLTIDGERIAPSLLALEVDRIRYPFDEFGRLSNVWWFILDIARVIAPLARPLRPGEHRVDLAISSVEPYITGGRFAFTRTSSKLLPLETEA